MMPIETKGAQGSVSALAEPMSTDRKNGDVCHWGVHRYPSTQR